MDSKKVVSGTFWQILNVGIFSIMNITYLMIMTRIVDKPAHGSFAVLFVVLLVLSMISRSGFAMALVKRVDNTSQQLSFAFYGSLFFGILFTIIFYFLAPVLFTFYGYDIDMFFVRLSSLYFVFLSIGLVPYALIVRNMEYKKLLIAQCTSFLIGSILLATYLANVGYSFGALVSGLLGFTFLNSIMMFILHPHSLKFSFSKSDISEVFHFSVGFVMSELLFSAANYVDKLIYAMAVSSASIAIYEKGQYITRLPVRIFGNAFDSVLYPLFSKLQSDKEKEKETFLILSKVSIFLASYIGITFFVFADVFSHFLYGPNWQETIKVIQIFSISIPLLIVTKLCDSVMRVHDKLYLVSRIKFVFTVLVILSSFSIFYFSYEKSMLLISLSYIILTMMMLGYTIKVLAIEKKKMFLGLVRIVLLLILMFIAAKVISLVISSDYGLILPIFSGLIQISIIFALIFYFPFFFGKKNVVDVISVIHHKLGIEIALVDKIILLIKSRD